ncbi:MAG TPA: phosphopantetheine-binding protein [Polyangiaceae bacterium]|jgi:acyl carrier protein|nr:phosphopantetheine-binding protein [Polyangiaceae bacterium]
MGSSEADIIVVVRSYMQKELLQSEVELGDETPLIEGGHLTSLQTVQLVMFIGEQYGVEIEPEEVNEDEFRSLKTIAALVKRKLPA